MSLNFSRTIILTFKLKPLGKAWTSFSLQLSYGFNSTTTVLLQEWLWHWITHDSWCAIKQRNRNHYSCYISIYRMIKEMSLPLWEHLYDIISNILKSLSTHSWNLSNVTTLMGAPSWYNFKQSLIPVNTFLESLQVIKRMFILCIFIRKAELILRRLSKEDCNNIVDRDGELAESF